MLLAGCPANSREWIVKQWVAYLKRAADFADLPLSCYMLVPKTAGATKDAFQEACLTYGVHPYLVETDEPERPDKRVWNVDRYSQMVWLRNTMLEHVRMLEPQWFLSVDSDILLGRDVIAKLQVGLDTYDAMGGKCWLHPSSKNIVNYANLNSNGNLLRKDGVGVITVQVLMAIKLMSPKAYWVDYEPHRQGEDIGWSLNARHAGCRLGWDGSAVSKHCMSPDALHTIDKRVGW